MPEHQVVSAAPTVPRLIRPTPRSMKQSEKRVIMFTAMETRRNEGNKKT